MYLRTLSGRKFYFENPTVAMVHDEDLATALSHVNRFAGHTPHPYSVAQHSINVMLYLRATGESERVQLAGLLHDAHEAYFGDITTPLKRFLDIKAAEDKIQTVVLQRFGLTDEDVKNPVIKDADTVALVSEAKSLLWPDSEPDADWASDFNWVSAEHLQKIPAPAKIDSKYVSKMFLRHLRDLHTATS